MKMWKIIGLFLGVGILLWGAKYLSTPTPGTLIADQGRGHVAQAEVEKFAYNSNPPTSGPHLETWVKPGIYTTPQLKGELIHSLEHGYIEIFYRCDTTKDPSCATIVTNLGEVAHKKKLFKLVVVPLATLDHTIALASWNYLDTLDTYDEARIIRFIDYHRDQGPEKTME